MQQKYVLIKNEADKELIIREFAELDKESMSLLCEETYPIDIIHSAIAAGENALVQALRTNNLYPPRMYAHKIAAAIIGLCNQEHGDTAELIFDDAELLSIERQSIETNHNNS